MRVGSIGAPALPLGAVAGVSIRITGARLQAPRPSRSKQLRASRMRKTGS